MKSGQYFISLLSSFSTVYLFARLEIWLKSNKESAYKQRDSI